MSPLESKHHRVRPEARRTAEQQAAPTIAHQLESQTQHAAAGSVLSQASKPQGTGKKRSMSGALLIPLILVALIFGSVGTLGKGCRFMANDVDYTGNTPSGFAGTTYTWSQDTTPSSGRVKVSPSALSAMQKRPVPALIRCPSPSRRSLAPR